MYANESSPDCFCLCGDEYKVMYNYFEINGYTMQSLNYPCDRFDISPFQYFKATKMYFDASEFFKYEKENEK